MWKFVKNDFHLRSYDGGQIFISDIYYFSKQLNMTFQTLSSNSQKTNAKCKKKMFITRYENKNTEEQTRFALIT